MGHRGCSVRTFIAAFVSRSFYTSVVGRNFNMLEWTLAGFETPQLWRFLSELD